MPPEVSSEIEASQYQLIPDTIQNAHVTKVDDVDPNTGKIKRTKSNLGEQITLDWVIDEGEYSGREIRFDNLTLGGSYKDAKTGEIKPLNTEPLCKFLSLTGVPWECKQCNNGKGARKFYVTTAADEPAIKRGRYICPDCKNPKNKISYNTSDFMGARLGLTVGAQKKQDSDKEFNTVKGYVPLRTY